MPLNIVICDRSKDFFMRLAIALQKIAAKQQYDATVKFTCLSPERILSGMARSEGQYLFIIEMRPDKAKVFEAIRQEFTDSYICFLTERGSSMEAMKLFLNLNLKPSGLIEKPPNIYEVAELIGRIYGDFLSTKDVSGDYLTVNRGFDVFKILVDDIIYFAAFAKKIEIHMRGKSVEYYKTLRDLEEQFDGRFIRCHKSFLINADKIRSVIFSEMLVEMENGEKLSISRTYKDGLKQFVAR